MIAERIPGFVVVVSTLPSCDGCEMADELIPNPARYDARTVFGSWANLCPEHFAEIATGVLGVGSGQYIVTDDEVKAGEELPPEVAEQIAVVRA